MRITASFWTVVIAPLLISGRPSPADDTMSAQDALLAQYALAHNYSRAAALTQCTHLAFVHACYRSTGTTVTIGSVVLGMGDDWLAHVVAITPRLNSIDDERLSARWRGSRYEMRRHAAQAVWRGSDTATAFPPGEIPWAPFGRTPQGPTLAQLFSVTHLRSALTTGHPGTRRVSLTAGYGSGEIAVVLDESKSWLASEFTYRLGAVVAIEMRVRTFAVGLGGAWVPSEIEMIRRENITGADAGRDVWLIDEQRSGDVCVSDAVTRSAVEVLVDHADRRSLPNFVRMECSTPPPPCLFTELRDHARRLVRAALDTAPAATADSVGIMQPVTYDARPARSVWSLAAALTGVIASTGGIILLAVRRSRR